MPIHYFTGKTQYSSDDIERVIELQWENEDYFVGNLEDMYKKLREPCTKQNALKFLDNPGIIEEIEVYQKKLEKVIKKRKKKQWARAVMSF